MQENGSLMNKYKLCFINHYGVKKGLKQHIVCILIEVKFTRVWTLTLL